MGTLAVVLVGLATREMAGARAGLAAAALGALYPVFWINDGALMSETLVLITVSLVIWQFYRLWHRPTLWGGLLLGACCGLATLTRVGVGPRPHRADRSRSVPLAWYGAPGCASVCAR